MLRHHRLQDFMRILVSVGALNEPLGRHGFPFQIQKILIPKLLCGFVSALSPRLEP